MLLPKCVTCKTDFSDKELIFEEKKNAILNSNISDEEIQKRIAVLLTDLEINKTLDTNIKGVLNIINSYAHIHKTRKLKKCSIINMGSIYGFLSPDFRIYGNKDRFSSEIYGASKAAVITLCESYGTDLKKYGISVSCICPGFVKTPLTAKNKHNMPFLMNLDKGAQKIKSALERRQRLYIFPWQSKIAIIMLNKMPRFLCRWIMELPFLNYTK